MITFITFDANHFELSEIKNLSKTICFALADNPHVKLLRFNTTREWEEFINSTILNYSYLRVFIEEEPKKIENPENWEIVLNGAKYLIDEYGTDYDSGAMDAFLSACGCDPNKNEEFKEWFFRNIQAKIDAENE